MTANTHGLSHCMSHAFTCVSWVPQKIIFSQHISLCPVEIQESQRHYFTQNSSADTMLRPQSSAEWGAFLAVVDAVCSAVQLTKNILEEGNVGKEFLLEKYSHGSKSRKEVS